MKPISKEEALALLAPKRREELRERAHQATKECGGGVFDFCAIINARSGRCSEDCKWCAQSAHYRTSCEAYGWVGAEKCAAEAAAAEAQGIRRIAIVTAGRGQTKRQVEEVREALLAMRRAAPRIHLCASLGLLDEEALALLKAAGLERIHCNIETAPSHFGEVCTTHSFADKLATLKAAKRLGLQVCCGGIIGMGETDEQLVEFAAALAEIAPSSIPINVLHPIAGTPLGGNGVLDPERVIDSIAVIRLMNPATPLRFAGGRRDMSDETARRCIYVGINAGIAGPLLTTPGAVYADDRQLALDAGYAV